MPRTKNTPMVELRMIAARIRNVAEAAEKIPPGATGDTWVSLAGGSMVRISDLRTVVAAYRQLQQEIKRRAGQGEYAPPEPETVDRDGIPTIIVPSPFPTRGRR